MFFTYFVGNRKMSPSPKRGIRKAQNLYFSVFQKIFLFILLENFIYY